jgi:hypothetical protein
MTSDKKLIPNSGRTRALGLSNCCWGVRKRDLILLELLWDISSDKARGCEETSVGHLSRVFCEAEFFYLVDIPLIPGA